MVRNLLPDATPPLHHHCVLVGVAVADCVRWQSLPALHSAPSGPASPALMWVVSEEKRAESAEGQEMAASVEEKLPYLPTLQMLGVTTCITTQRTSDNGVSVTN